MPISTDMLIPFMPRTVQNKLKPPRLTVKAVVKDAHLFEDYQHDKYYEHRLPVKKKRDQNQSEPENEPKSPADLTNSAEEKPQEEQKTEGVTVDAQGRKHVDITI